MAACLGLMVLGAHEEGGESNLQVGQLSWGSSIPVSVTCCCLAVKCFYAMPHCCYHFHLYFCTDVIIQGYWETRLCANL